MHINKVFFSFSKSGVEQLLKKHIFFIYIIIVGMHLLSGFYMV